MAGGLISRPDKKSSSRPTFTFSVRISPVPGKNLCCKLDNLTVFRNGKAVRFDVKKAEQVVSKRQFTITISLAAGSVSDFCFGCDLSKEYVAINADYHT